MAMAHPSRSRHPLQGQGFFAMATIPDDNQSNPESSCLSLSARLSGRLARMWSSRSRTLPNPRFTYTGVEVTPEKLMKLLEQTKMPEVKIDEIHWRVTCVFDEENSQHLEERMDYLLEGLESNSRRRFMFDVATAYIEEHFSFSSGKWTKLSTKILIGNAEALETILCYVEDPHYAFQEVRNLLPMVEATLVGEIEHVVAICTSCLGTADDDSIHLPESLFDLSKLHMYSRKHFWNEIVHHHSAASAITRIRFILDDIPGAICRDSAPACAGCKKCASGNHFD